MGGAGEFERYKSATRWTKPPGAFPKDPICERLSD
jgi:hypothetical protein